MKLSTPNDWLKTIAFTLLAFMLSACEGEINTNENAFGSTPDPTQNDVNDNDDYFHAYRLYTTSTHSDSLSATDTVDYFFVELATNTYRTYTFELTGLTGDADIELINSFLNKESWSDNNGTEAEMIGYWRDYNDYDNNIVYLKVINRSGTDLNYTLEIN